MLGVLDTIGTKIDTILRDEQALRESVLNGHAATHDEHHRWIAKILASGGYCDYVAQKKQEEAEAALTKQSVWRKFLEGAAAHAGSVLAGGVLMWLAMTIHK